ncbi:hypothetical protein BZA05DRAFT_429730 [Tricharina praecox]|uniref:uncharacterized protein n=1 Tax=Tricharina praecox TaxID=43433 RepID=UPI00221EB882|nr:uncharacterized protein BZA05DRAFT_429730 [Tricharina praecox]KAI5853769.1 hypothetical protein BZA05DRAFT_429730 [Tricharina praecox]
MTDAMTPPEYVCNDILTLFHRTFSIPFSRPDLHQVLQTVKGHLYNRDFSAAFGTVEHLNAYVIRWSPSRALCYRSVFLSLCDEITDVFQTADVSGTSEIVCIGGGAGAELVGAAAATRNLLPRGEVAAGKVHVTAIDIAEWNEPFSALTNDICENYIPNTQPGVFSADFYREDILAPSVPLENLIPASTRLITLLFTTNELYTQSRAATTKLLLSLAGIVEKGCLLLVLESAGSYSTVQVGEKTFSMGMLLEHTLLGPDGDWEKIEGDDAKWFRLPGEGKGLRYPLALENMRYFVRVFRRL